MRWRAGSVKIWILGAREVDVAYDSNLAERVRGCLQGESGLSEAEMFGGLAFMIDGNMSCGVTGGDLIVRVGPEHHEEMLQRRHARPFDMTGRPMKGWVVVGGPGLENDDVLAQWVTDGLSFARTLPAK